MRTLRQKKLISGPESKPETNSVANSYLVSKSSTDETAAWTSPLMRKSFQFCPETRTYLTQVQPKILEFDLCPWIGHKYQTRCLRWGAGTIPICDVKGHPNSIARPNTTEYCFACRILSTSADTCWCKNNYSPLTAVRKRVVSAKYSTGVNSNRDSASFCPLSRTELTVSKLPGF
jgi:hypothetical protein